MVSRDDKNSILIPRLFPCRFKILFQGIVCILYRFVHFHKTFFKFPCVLCRNFKWMMRRRRKNRCHKWFIRLSYIFSKILQKRLIPNCPNPIKIIIIIILSFSKIILETEDIRKSLKAHRAIRRTVIKRSFVAQFIRHRNDGLYLLVGIRRTRKSIL